MLRCGPQELFGADSALVSPSTFIFSRFCLGESVYGAQPNIFMINNYNYIFLMGRQTISNNIGQRNFQDYNRPTRPFLEIANPP